MCFVPAHHDIATLVFYDKHGAIGAFFAQLFHHGHRSSVVHGMVNFGFRASMRIKFLFRHQLVALNTHTFATGASFCFDGRCMVAHDVGGIHINQIIATFGRAFEKHFFLFVLISHEGKLKMFFNDPVPLQKGHCFAVDATIDGFFAVGRTGLAHGAITRKFPRVLNLFQMSLNAVDAEEMRAGRTDPEFWYFGPANRAHFVVVLFEYFFLVPCL